MLNFSVPFFVYIQWYMKWIVLSEPKHGSKNYHGNKKNVGFGIKPHKIDSDL